MRPPAFVIRLELEAEPRLYCDAENEGEHRRLLDWIEANPELAELLEHVDEIRQSWQQRRAA